MPNAPLPLSGGRILDVATFVAAPYCATTLSEFGAEVIKIEEPARGDPFRRFGTATERADSTLAWLSEARNKKSITLNLRTSEGASLFRRLIYYADVVCEKSSAAAKTGFPYCHGAWKSSGSNSCQARKARPCRFAKAPLSVMSTLMPRTP